MAAALALAAFGMALPGEDAYAQFFIPIDDTATVARGGTTTSLDSGAQSVLANDIVIGQGQAELQSAPRRGSVTLNADGTFLYTHNGSSADTDDFTYRICASRRGCSAAAEVRITVAGVAMPPTITGQRQLTTPEDTAIQVTLADLTVDDPDSAYPDDFSLTVGNGENYSLDGTTVVPADDFAGDLTVPVRVNDGQFDSNEFPLRIGVTPVNDAPTVVADVGEQQAVEGEPFELELAQAFADPDSDVLQFSASGLPPSGSLQLNASTGRLSGTPVEVDTLNLEYTVTVTATDPSGASASTSFGLRVLPSGFDLSITIDVAPNPTTIAAAPVWTLTVANSAASASEPALLTGRWHSTLDELELTALSDCTVDDNLTNAPRVSCEIPVLQRNDTIEFRIEARQTAPGDQAVSASVNVDDENEANDLATRSLNLAGSFNEGPAQRLAGTAVALAAADLDGDGAVDLAGVDDQLRVYFNEGDRSLATTPYSPAEPSAGTELAILDWNGDGRLDIAVLGPEGSGGRVFVNDGARGFTAGPALPSLSVYAAITADIDADGRDDLVIVGDDGTVHLRREESPAIIDTRAARDVAAADFDGDGRTDLAVVLASPGMVAILPGADGGMSATLSDLGNLNGIKAGDLDADGSVDLVLAVGSAGGSLPAKVVLRNDGAGTFTRVREFGATDTKDLPAADVNDDGIPDVVSINDTGVHQVYFGKGQAELELQAEFLLSPETNAAAMADYDGDGVPDLFLSGRNAANIHVLRNNGIGRFGLGDVNPPVIELLGPARVTVPAASAYEDAGATAFDDISGDLSDAIDVDNPVNTGIVGTYEVHYSVTDRAGNTSPTVVRTVTVEPATGGGGGGGAWAPAWLVLLAVAAIAGWGGRRGIRST